MKLTEDLFIETCENISGYDGVIINESLSIGKNAHRFSYIEGAISYYTGIIYRLGYGHSSGGTYRKTSENFNVLILTKQEFIDKFINNKKQKLRKAIRSARWS